MPRTIYIRPDTDGNIVTWGDDPLADSITVTSVPDDFSQWGVGKYIWDGSKLAARAGWVAPVLDADPLPSEPEAPADPE
jgi:hypothetical protein